MNLSVQKLAYYGGKPTFTEKLFVGRPNIGSRQRLLARINLKLGTLAVARSHKEFSLTVHTQRCVDLYQSLLHR